ncbi:Phospholipase D Transphosphatidylase [Seminavis robusta]|uniref:Phospholipase D Transphosphatidylase n=1 Tax=Seminavis robusta TaxID=568900 RepID=A0A9N8E9E6_9STRA|nr:Phospholipase D Transphosphatidylase [Seminavis robusta]|eukprot:Sro770_g199940.1 Phospholipase D Transphosphatidylase (694) ;mRNA; r:13074-15155
MEAITVDNEVAPPPVVAFSGRRHQRAMTAPADFFFSVGSCSAEALVTPTTAQLLEQQQSNLVEAAVLSVLLPAVLALAPSPEAIATSLLQQYCVILRDDHLADSIDAMEPLIASYNDVEGGRAPGFFLSKPNGNLTGWKRSTTIPCYDALCLQQHGRSSLPLPNATFLVQCLRFVQEALEQRHTATTDSCSCFNKYGFHEGSVAKNIVNLALEQLMILQPTLVLNESIHVTEWNEKYNHNANDEITLQETIHPDTRVRLLRHRDDYAQAAVETCLAATRSIILTTCYLFGSDPFVRYLLLDVLPYCVRHHGVTVRIMVDLMTMEAAMVQSAFAVDDACHNNNGPTGDVTETSFFQRLGGDAPAAQNKTPANMVEFLQTLLALQSESYQVRWWCAKDANREYRIKNHSKGIIVDGQVAIMGGSNVCPTMAAAKTEIDMVVCGSVVREIAYSTEELWRAMEQEDSLVSEFQEPSSPLSTRLQRVLDKQEWNTTQDCDAHFLRSNPSSDGEDCILRAVLQAIEKAQTSVHMCFGHANFPIPVCELLRRATDRGVVVKVLVNSMYSCDLRGGQQDLFRSIQTLLQMAPKVQVYSTFLVEHQEEGQATKKPPFIHAKYVTIDGHWSAVGSWNLWHRAAFYEIEHELFVPNSRVLAQELVRKFDDDQANACVLVPTPEACGLFLPKGCVLCRGFGPFYP